MNLFPPFWGGFLPGHPSSLENVEIMSRHEKEPDSGSAFQDCVRQMAGDLKLGPHQPLCLLWHSCGLDFVAIFGLPASCMLRAKEKV